MAESEKLEKGCNQRATPIRGPVARKQYLVKKAGRREGADLRMRYNSIMTKKLTKHWRHGIIANSRKIEGCINLVNAYEDDQEEESINVFRSMVKIFRRGSWT